MSSNEEDTGPVKGACKEKQEKDKMSQEVADNKMAEGKDTTHFFNISNLVAKAPGLNLGKKLSNLLSNRELLN